MMDRRTFVKSALGLVVLAACPVLAEVASSEKGARTTAEELVNWARGLGIEP